MTTLPNLETRFVDADTLQSQMNGKITLHMGLVEQNLKK